MKKLTIEQARNYLINYHFLNQEKELLGLDGIKTVFERLRTVQFDPLNVVGNNLDLVLQSRISNYKKDMITKLLYEERYLVDGFDKMMSVYLTSDFPKFSKIREYLSQARLNDFNKDLALKDLNLIEPIIELIKTEGPVFAKDLNMGKRVNHQFGSMKETTLTLDYLFHHGDILVNKKKNNQKQYDLSENIIGEIAKEDDEFKNDDEFTLWYLYRRIKAMGLVWNKSSVVWSGYKISDKSVRTKYLNKLLDLNLITQININDLDESFYAITKHLDFIESPKQKICFVAPLDNLIWDRELVKTIFCFDYTWEVYVPKAKRKYGYYVLPILYGNKFIGRIEFSKYQKRTGLEINQIWYENKPSQYLIEDLENALKKFSDYLN